MRVTATVAAVEEALAADETRYRAEQREAQNEFERRLVDLATTVNTLQARPSVLRACAWLVNALYARYIT